MTSQLEILQNNLQLTTQITQGIESEISEQGTDKKVELLRSKIRTKESYKNVSSAEITKLLSPTAGTKNTREINERNVQVVQVQAE